MKDLKTFYDLFFSALFLIFVIFLYTLSGCGGGGSNSSKSTITGNVEADNFAKYYIDVTLKFPERKKVGKYGGLYDKVYDDILPDKVRGSYRLDHETSKIAPELDYYILKLLMCSDGSQVYDTMKVERPDVGNVVTVRFWDVPEGSLKLVVKAYSASKVLVGEGESLIEVSLASVTGSGSEGSGGGTLGENNEPVVLPTGTVADGPSCPKIKEVRPNPVGIGDACTVTGSGFGNMRENSEKSYVYFGGAKATEYVYWSDDYIVCRVPKNASHENLNVSVSVGGGVSGALVSAVNLSSIINVQPAPSGGGGGGSGGGGASILTKWKKLYGGTGADYIQSVSILSDGSSIIAGYSLSNDGDLNGLGAHGSNDGWIMKLDSSGNIIWKKLCGGTGADNIESLYVFSDGSSIVAGNSASSDGDLSGLGAHGSSDGWIMKLDSSGNIVWKKLYGGTGSDVILNIAILSDGSSSIVTGYSGSSDGDLSGLGAHGSSDGWIMKLDSSGNIVWKKLYGGTGIDSIRAISVFSDGSSIVAGYSISSDGDLTGLGAHGTDDGWIMKLDSSGNIVWKKLYGGTGADNIQAVSILPDGNNIVTGYSGSSDGDLSGLGAHGTDDGWIMKLDSSGNIVWKKLYGGTGSDVFFINAILSDGSNIVAGRSNSSDGDLSGLGAHGSNDGWVMKLDSSGNVVWKKLYGGTGVDYIRAVSVLSDGSNIVAGYSTSNNGDLSGLGAHGANDGWIMSLDKNGDL